MDVDKLINNFVERINYAAREPVWPDDVPPSLRLGPPDDHGMYDWRIQRQEGIDWIASVEATLPAPLPPSFRSLVTRYAYPQFEAGGLWFFANTREQTWHEWRTSLFADKALSDPLLKAGYIQFARPDTGNYDPICFDTKRRATSGECPIVRIGHEQILCNNKVKIYKEVAPSFANFVQDFLSGEIA